MDEEFFRDHISAQGVCQLLGISRSLLSYRLFGSNRAAEIGFPKPKCVFGRLFFVKKEIAKWAANKDVHCPPRTKHFSDETALAASMASAPPPVTVRQLQIPCAETRARKTPKPAKAKQPKAEKPTQVRRKRGSRSQISARYRQAA